MAFTQIVLKWNRVLNLVSRNDALKLRERHIDDGLGLIPWLSTTTTYLDVGSGGGFPAIPIAIARPTIQVTLVERSTRKCQFLRHAAMELGLANVVVECVDVRQFNPEGLFDTVTARAVAVPATVWGWTQHLISCTGQLLVQTAEPFQGELPNGRIRETHPGRRGWVSAIVRNS